MAEARRRHEFGGEARRWFKGLRYCTRKSGPCERRVVAKGEPLSGGENPRFIVASIPVEQWAGREWYEQGDCARGEMENRLQEPQGNLLADRPSSHWMQANQLRLYFASFAYGMMDGFRRPGLGGTKRARAQCGTTREKVLKVGAEIRVSVRKVWLSMSGRDPRAEWFRRILARLQAIPHRCSV